MIATKKSHPMIHSTQHRIRHSLKLAVFASGLITAFISPAWAIQSTDTAASIIPAQTPPEVLAQFEAQRQKLSDYGLPIISPSLHVGQISPRIIHATHLPQPIFLVGCQKHDCHVSVQWLRTHQAELQAIRAIGWLISANDLTAVKQIEIAANGLPLVKASGELFAKQYGIHRYPVLITRKHLEQ